MTNDLNLICDACGQLIGEERLGYLWVDRGAVDRARQAVAEWEQKHAKASDQFTGGFVVGGAALLEYPALVRWQAHHGPCDPDPDVWAYDIASGNVRTWEQLLERTAHLMGKPWLQLTDWRELLRGVAYGKTRLTSARGR